MTQQRAQYIPFERGAEPLERAIGRAIEKIGAPDFFPAALDCLRSAAPFVGAFAVKLVALRRPQHLFDNVRAERRSAVIEQYLDGAYLLDPFYEAYTRLEGDALLHLSEVAPDRFQQTAYFRQYYREIGLKDEVAVFVRLADKRYVFLSIGRRSAETRFLRRDIQALREMLPVFASLLRRHYRLLEDGQERAAETEPESPQRLEHAMEGFGRAELTAREKEIADLILKGHSSKSIARLFEISPGTVKLHRKKIYRKLEVTSQSELFARFLTTLE